MHRAASFPRWARLGAAWLLAMTVPARLAPGEEVLSNSSKECAICHIRWVQALDRSQWQESSMQAVMEKQAGSGDMCLSCHDGSVVDSRFQVWATHHHATDTVPSPAVRIPTDKFPLDDQGRMTCATCHTAHAVPGDSDLRTVIFLRQPNVDSSLCLACHAEHAQKSDCQHPLGRAESPVPKVILDAGGKTSPDGHAILCQTCHEPHGAQNPWMLVLPPSELCIACHTAKAPEISPPAGAPMHRIGHTYTGFKPPATLLSEKATFGPNGELSCLSCHRLHDASGAKPLLIRKNESSSLCLECHPKEKAIIDSPHDLRVSSPETTNARGEKPAVSGPCGACHRIHGWARDVPETNRPHSSGCMECHQPGGPGSRNRPYLEAHPVGVSVPQDMSPPLPLDAASRGIGCLTCHDPHTPRPPVMETPAAGPEVPGVPSDPHRSAAGSPPPNGSGITAPRSFLRQEGSQLCVLCHDKVAACLQGAHDPAGFAPSLREALGVHPTRGACRVCHATHNAQGPHLWARTPADSPADPNSNLCVACHNNNLVKNPQGTNHPLTSTDCGLRIMSLRAERGNPDCGLKKPGNANPKSPRASCTSCHNPHVGAESAAQLRDAPDGLCLGCHEDKEGIKGSVHDPSANEWAKKLSFAPRALCRDCHPIHGPPKQSGIWPALGGELAPENLCEACHRFGRPGPTVETPHVGKTLDGGFRIMSLRAERGNPDLELTRADPADGTPSKMRRAGDSPPQSAIRHPPSEISCATCHDIHQDGQTSPTPDRPDAQRRCGDAVLRTGPAAQRPSGRPHSGPPDQGAGKLLRASRQDSALCLTCHPESGRLLDSPHDLRKSAPAAQNVRGEVAGESGPCGSCHLVHPVSPVGQTWAQLWPAQSAGGQGLCTGCHSPDLCAAGRVPARADHPEVPLLNRTALGQPDYMPTFDERGRPSPTGTISCPTCHAVHALPEGAAFLRPAHQKLCVDCHGAEALWRFLYYHKATRNPPRSAAARQSGRN